jgi:hypothetical protein
MPKDSPGQIAKLQLKNMGYSGQANDYPSYIPIILFRIVNLLTKFDYSPTNYQLSM